MGLFDFLYELKNSYESRNAEYREEERLMREELSHASNIASIMATAAENGIDLFEGSEKNGYVKNNNTVVERYVQRATPSFEAQGFMSDAKMLFAAVNAAQSYNELAGEYQAMVDEKFDFAALKLKGKIRFSVSYLSAYGLINKESEEIIRAYISVIDSECKKDTDAKRFFMTFKRPSLLKPVDKRLVKVTACPNCGAPVSFGRKNTAKCSYCSQFVKFEDGYWTLCKIEPITGDTEIINTGLYG